MRYRLIALDLDDTTIDSKGRLPERVKQEILRARDAGIHIVLASGRSSHSVRPYYEALGLDTPIICFAGAQIVAADGKKLLARTIDAKRALEVGQELGVYTQLYADDYVYYLNECEGSRYYCEYFKIPGKAIPDLLERDDVASPKALFMDDPEQIETLRPLVEARMPGHIILRSRPMFIEAHNPEASKGNCLEFLSRYYDVDPAEMVSIGDSQIDSSMLRYTGLGLAVENGYPDVKALANAVIPSNDQEGVAWAIQKYIFEEDPK